MTLNKAHALTSTATRWLLLFYVVALPVVRPLDTRVFGIHVLATDLLFAAAFLFWLVAAVLKRRQFNRRYFIVVGTFLLALTASALFSTEPRKSLFKLTGVFYLIAVSVVVADLVRDTQFLKQFIYAWTIGAVITIFATTLGLVGFCLGYDSMATNFFLFHAGSLPPGDYPRVMAFFENPNMNANYTNVAAIVILGGGHIGWLSKRMWVTIVIALFGSTILTISPGIGGMILSLGIWYYFTGNWKHRHLVLAGCMLLGFFVLLATAISPITRETENTVTVPIIEKRIEPSVRFLVWKDSLERGIEYPLFGRGTGTDAANVRFQTLSGQRQFLTDAHQAWLNVFGQSGLIGLTAFVVLCWYLFSICRFRSGAESPPSKMLVACSCAFVGAFLFQNLFGSFEDARQLWVLIGMLVGLSVTKEDLELGSGS